MHYCSTDLHLHQLAGLEVSAGLPPLHPSCLVEGGPLGMATPGSLLPWQDLLLAASCYRHPYYPCETSQQPKSGPLLLPLRLP